jgi:hypothetical protein
MENTNVNLIAVESVTSAYQKTVGLKILGNEN